MRWPTRDNLLLFLGLSLLLFVLFLLVYGGSNWMNVSRGEHYSLYAAWELNIPLLPVMIFPYLSISLFFQMPVLILDREALILLGIRIAAAIVVAGFIFILLPTELGFERSLETESTYPLFRLMYLLDQPHNLFPSLHVALSGIVLLAMLGKAKPGLSLILLAWWLLMCVSVVLVHQHHLLDIVGGVLLAALVFPPHSGPDD